MDEINYDTGSLSNPEGDGWDSIDLSDISEPDETPNECTLEEIEADWNGAEQTYSKGKNKSAGGDVPSVGEGQSSGLFALKHLDRTLNVGRDEVVKLAQKGLDYDRVKTKYSQLSTFKAENEGAFDYVSRLAKERGLSVAELVSSAKAGGAYLNNRHPGDIGSADKGGEFGTDIDELIANYPGVSLGDIPQGIWEKVSKGKNLLAAYAIQENERLRTELEAERQNKRNRESSVGSLSSEGKSDRLSEIERLWYEDD